MYIIKQSNGWMFVECITLWVHSCHRTPKASFSPLHSVPQLKVTFFPRCFVFLGLKVLPGLLRHQQQSPSSVDLWTAQTFTTKQLQEALQGPAGSISRLLGLWKIPHQIPEHHPVGEETLTNSVTSTLTNADQHWATLTFGLSSIAIWQAFPPCDLKPVVQARTHHPWQEAKVPSPAHYRTWPVHAQHGCSIHCILWLQHLQGTVTVPLCCLICHHCPLTSLEPRRLRGSIW